MPVGWPSTAPMLHPTHLKKLDNSKAKISIMRASFFIRHLKLFVQSIRYFRFGATTAPTIIHPLVVQVRLSLFPAQIPKLSRKTRILAQQCLLNR